MAARYVYSGAAGAGTGADWANAHTTLALAIAAATAGDAFYVAHDHSESTASALTLTFPGTPAAPDRIICANRAGTVPPVAADLLATAVVATSGNSTIILNGDFYCYGLQFRSGVGASGTASLSLGNDTSAQSYESCVFELATTGTGSRINPALGAGLRALFKNCTAKFQNVTQSFTLGAGNWTWDNGGGDILASGSAIPGTLFRSSGRPTARLAALDLSQFGSGTTIIGTHPGCNPVQLINCKLDASVTVAVSPSEAAAAPVDLIGCDSAGAVARNERYMYQGTLTTETTIVRTGGASDGTTAYSWKVTTTANSERDFPFETFEGAIWNEDTGSAKTLTVHIVTDNVTLTDAEIWLEAEYLGSSATPVAGFISDAPATVLTAGANQASSSETWTTTGLGTPVKQKLEVTFTPEMVGFVRFRVKVAKPSTTVYIDPPDENALA